MQKKDTSLPIWSPLILSR